MGPGKEVVVVLGPGATPVVKDVGVDAGRIGDPPPPTKHEGFGGATPGVLVGDELNKKIYAALTAGLKGHEKQKKTRNYLEALHDDPAGLFHNTGV